MLIVCFTREKDGTTHCTPHELLIFEFFQINTLWKHNFYQQFRMCCLAHEHMAELKPIIDEIRARGEVGNALSLHVGSTAGLTLHTAHSNPNTCHWVMPPYNDSLYSQFWCWFLALCFMIFVRAVSLGSGNVSPTSNRNRVWGNVARNCMRVVVIVYFILQFFYLQSDEWSANKIL